jgi:hypothetical protein
LQITYQQNYDKFYRETEKRYITINDYSGWFKTVKAENKNNSIKNPAKISAKNSKQNQNNSSNLQDQNKEKPDTKLDIITEQIFF